MQVFEQHQHHGNVYIEISLDAFNTCFSTYFNLLAEHHVILSYECMSI